MKKLNWIFFLMGIISIPALHAQRWDAIPTGINLKYEQPPNFIYADSTYIYMSGRFHIIDGQHIQGIARWNGIKWDSMGAGLDRLIMYDSLSYNPSPIYAMTPYHNKLYVGGEFSSLGYLNAPAIGTWNGKAWDSVPVQPFKNESYMGPTGAIAALTVINNKLYMGGEFDTVAGQPCIGIAYWNDTNWSSLNFSPELYFDQINAICEYKGSIYVGGSFDGTNTRANICRWDSLGWHSMGIGVRGSLANVWCMAVYDGALYVGGAFSTSDGNAGNNIEKWDGTQWSDVSGGTDYQVENLLVYNGKLYAMGQLMIAGGVSADKIAEWDGTKWCSFGGNIYNTISTACIYKDTLYIGGGFEAFANDTVKYLAKWAGGSYTDSCEDVTGINEVKGGNGNVKVYPNPSNGLFTLVIASEAKQSPNTIEVYNVLGENIYKAKINSDNTEINLSGQPNGVYLYRVISQDGSLVGEGKEAIQH